MNRDDGGPAFPVPDGAESMPGMTLRDHFAGMAMAAMIGAYPAQAIDTGEGGLLFDNEAIAYDAYEVADAMLKAREE